MRRALGFLLGLLVLAGPARAAEAPLPVVASFSLLGDLVQQVGGEQVAVRTLVGPDSDAHAVQPTPAMARAVAGAAVLFSNGLGFEGWMARFLRAAGFTGRHVVLGEGLPARPASGGHDHDVDPHVWQDIGNAVRMVAGIAQALCHVDPAHCARYLQRAAETTTRLRTLDAEIRAGWAAVPPDRRVVITTHEAFGYYGAAYGVRFLAAQGVSTTAEASPRAVAALLRQIRSTGARALFLERTGDPRLIERIAQDSGVTLGGTLYADALSAADGPAPSYEALMRHNTRTLLRAVQTR